MPLDEVIASALKTRTAVMSLEVIMAPETVTEFFPPAFNNLTP